MLETKDSVYHEHYVSVRLFFHVAKEMLIYFEAIYPAYLLYLHQQKVFERLKGDDGSSTLVETDIDSGKTESFLLIQQMVLDSYYDQKYKKDKDCTIHV